MCENINEKLGRETHKKILKLYQYVLHTGHWQTKILMKNDPVFVATVPVVTITAISLAVGLGDTWWKRQHDTCSCFCVI